MPVYPHLAFLVNTIKIDKYQFFFFTFRNCKGFTIPANSTGQCATTRRCRIFLIKLTLNAPVVWHIQRPPGRIVQCGLLRAGHIPGAKNIPWAKAVNPDGTFKSAEELRALYEPLGITKDKDIVVYCRIAERSSHSWFVLKYLLGYPHVKNYDGSWTEWGNLVGVPIAVGEEPGVFAR